MHTHTISVCMHDHARRLHATLVDYERATSVVIMVVIARMEIERVMKSIVFPLKS